MMLRQERGVAQHSHVSDGDLNSSGKERKIAHHSHVSGWVLFHLGMHPGSVKDTLDLD